ncbi:Erv1/Alr family FAD-linked sulfhydryl oxidase [Paragemmobacter aquarius]|nr:ERV1/ALR-related protein [Gemmobacter aquarius]
MNAPKTYDDITALWQSWCDARGASGQGDPAVALKHVLAERRIPAGLADLRRALALCGPVATIDRQGFIDAILPVVAAPALRLEHAFAYFGATDAELPVERVRDVLGHLFHDGDMLDAMLADLDANGDRCVTFDDFLEFYPEKAAAEPDGVAVSAPLSQAAVAAPRPVSRAHFGDVATSPLQMQTGFFRLLQGAAYRTFRESYSANSESHLRARDLPYTVSDFAVFVRAATEFYLSLGLVEGDRAVAEFHRLVALVEAQHQSLCVRIATWDKVAKTDAMLAAEAVLEGELAALADHRERFAEAVEYLLALRAHRISPTEVRADSLTRHEMDRLRHGELNAEHGHVAPRGGRARPGPYHDSWSPVVLAAGEPRAAGTIMPVAFWYDDFMPQLLLCVSILTDADLDAETSCAELELDAWHAGYAGLGAFDRYGTDLRDGFAACPVRVKLALRQAWRLSEHYLNSLQKRRERAEFGRETGYLSQYVSFIDLHLGRTDVADAEMRISFPYFIGPAVWCLLHTAANLVEDMSGAAKSAAVDRFKAFFRAFATMYPCPYCRYHLNRYVVRNREVNFYPVEFLLLGQREDRDWFDISLDDRLATISADKSGSFALFVWKLHNAVSSSIARTEEWYHREEHPLYTTRFWPGLDTEIARMRSSGIEQMPVGRLAAIYGVIKPSVELATLRDEIQLALHGEKATGLDAITARAADCVSRLETAMTEADLLRQTYVFDSTKFDPPPHISEQEESYARSGYYVER